VILRVLSNAALCAALLSGCAPNWQDWQAAERGQTVQSAEVRIAYFIDQPLQPIDEYSHQAITLHFPIIQGSLFGTPSRQPTHKQRNVDSQPLSLDLDRLGSQLEQRAKPLTDSARADGLSILPADTRLARVATFAFDSSGRALGSTAFMDAQSTRLLMLVWFDRAAELKGKNRDGDVIYDYRLRVDRPGLYWVEDDNRETGIHKLRIVPPPSSIFFAIFPPLQAI